MQELLFGPLLLTWGPPVLAFIKQHPWQLFAALLVFVLLLDLIFRKRSSSSDGGDLGLFDSGGDGDGDGGCGD